MSEEKQPQEGRHVNRHACRRLVYPRLKKQTRPSIRIAHQRWLMVMRPKLHGVNAEN